MVKIVEIEEEADAGRARDDECYEIDPAEFVSKVNLRSSDDDDVLIVAAKGQIEVEVDQLEDTAKTLNCHDTEERCKSVDGDDNLREYAAGDCLANPYRIDEDETTLHKEKNDEDKCVLPKLSAKSSTDDGKCMHAHEDERIFEVVPGKPPVVKCEPQDRNGVEEDACCCPEMDDSIDDELYPEEYRAFDEENDEDVVVVGREAL